MSTSAHILFFGDLHLNSAREDSLFDPDLSVIAGEHDLVVGNFEGAGWHPDAHTDKKAGPALIMGEHAAARIRNTGFGLLTLANNHCMDFGPTGITAARESLSGISLIGAGLTRAEAERPGIVTLKGIKIGFLAGSETQYGTLSGIRTGPGCASLCRPDLLDSIRMMRSECAHVVLLAHAGLENVPLPLPEWRAFYHACIDAGASAVVASHPHVPQGTECYHGGVILYSLGNTAWDPVQNSATDRSLAASLTLSQTGLPVLRTYMLRYDGDFLHLCSELENRELLAGLNAPLSDPCQYKAEIQAICRDFYRTAAIRDFHAITGSYPGGAWQKLKNGLKQVLRRPSLNDPLLTSMLENETYRWTVLAAIREQEKAE